MTRVQQPPSDSSTETRLHSDWIELRGHRLYWEMHGTREGPTLVLLHHGLGSISSWRRQIPHFARAGFCVLAIDRWGYGKSDPRPSFEKGFLFHDAEDTLALLDTLDIHHAHFLGHSDGGTIAVILASDAPQRTLRLCLVAAHIYIEPKMLDGLKKIQTSAQRQPLRGALRREHGERAESLVEEWVHHWYNVDLGAMSLTDRLAKITAATLVIQGEEDEHATIQHAMDIAEGIKESELWLIPDVAHMPIHEIPEEFNQRVYDFLQKYHD